MEKEIMIIKNVRGYQDGNGVAQLNLEDVSRGLGFTQTKGNVEYIRWETIKKYLEEFSFPTSWENKNGIATSCDDEKLPEYIPENIFYKLCFKAKNEVARRFQDIVTDEVLPSIRRTGGYIAGEKDMTEDELVLKAMNVLNKKVEDLRTKNEKLLAENNMKDQLIGELKPKADYVDTILQNKGLVTITAIAKDYGMSGEKMNEKLHDLGVQYKQSNQWLLYAKYHDNGYTHSETIDLKHRDGTSFVRMNTKWTQKGRLFIYELLKKNGLIPVIER